jgi:hypothetical protein
MKWHRHTLRRPLLAQIVEAGRITGKAPTGDEGHRTRRATDVYRDGIVDDAAHAGRAGRRHRNFHIQTLEGR